LSSKLEWKSSFDISTIKWKCFFSDF
jgi:hypothetical protein